MNNIIWRKVIKYDWWYVYQFYTGSTAQVEKLSCGHDVHNKGSVGRATKRKCSTCMSLRGGMSIKWPTLNLQEVWNPDTELPIKLPITEE